MSNSSSLGPRSAASGVAGVHAMESPTSFAGPLAYQITQDLPIPSYLEQTYWWAYLHPNGVRFFERQWLVNVILWGNFARLRDAALSEIDARNPGSVLQVACVYGDFTPRLVQRIALGNGHLDVVDVAPVQLDNLRRKVGACAGLDLHHQDSTRLGFPDRQFDHVVVFFLLHEQPAEARLRTIREALRVVRPNGKLIVVDYHAPDRWSPLRYVMYGVLAALEPFAMDLWRQEIMELLPPDTGCHAYRKETFFGGLYQKVVITR
jgi:ubiquinone/menaquinone biosynthesis C-methylase UbiE